MNKKKETRKPRTRMVISKAGIGLITMRATFMSLAGLFLGVLLSLAARGSSVQAASVGRAYSWTQFSMSKAAGVTLTLILIFGAIGVVSGLLTVAIGDYFELEEY